MTMSSRLVPGKSETPARGEEKGLSRYVLEGRREVQKQLASPLAILRLQRLRPSLQVAVKKPPFNFHWWINGTFLGAGGLREREGWGGGRETRGLCYRRPPELTFPPRVLTPPATAAPPSPRRLGERNARPNPLPAQCRSPLPPSARLTGAHPGTITRGITPNRLLCRGARCVNAALLQRLHGSGS